MVVFSEILLQKNRLRFAGFQRVGEEVNSFLDTLVDGLNEMIGHCNGVGNCSNIKSSDSFVNLVEGGKSVL